MKPLITIFATLMATGSALALEPANVFLLANKNLPASQEVAEHYCAKRRVPKEKKEQAKVLLAIYGVPLRVGSPEATEEEKGELAKLDAELAASKADVERFEKLVPIAEAENKEKNTDETKEALASRKQELDTAKRNQRRQQRNRDQIGQSGRFDSRAAVDSELMLLWWDKYELR